MSDTAATETKAIEAQELQPTTRLQRWRMVLGGPADASCGGVSGRLQEMDQALAALYEEDSKLASRRGGRGNSSPSVSRWLGDIRKYFPSQVVQVMQRDVATGLPSELDAQVMAVSRAGDEVGVPTPVFDVVGAVLAPREAAAREEAAARAGR